MVSIRRATFDDLVDMQKTNIFCLPENYNIRYFLYHCLQWPYLLYCAEDYDKKIVGYVLAKLEDEDEQADKTKGVHGHITSVSILRTHRRMGIATKLMKQSLIDMKEVFNAKYCSLHVRAFNAPAFNLYNKVLGFE